MVKLFNAKILNSFLSEEECDEIVWVANSRPVWEKSNNIYWDDRVISIENSYRSFGDEFGNFLKDKTYDIKKYIEKAYNLEKNIYPDSISICRWFPGNEQFPHADDMKNVNVSGFEHRVFASIIYLNTNFTGGVTYYPDYNIEVVPEKGKLAVHPGDSSHMHGVTKVGSDIRYTIASFWTYEEGRNVGWPASK